MMMQSKQGTRLAEWEAQIEACRESGQSVVAWCRAQGLSSRQLKYWIRRYEKEVAGGDGMPQNVQEPTQWVPVAISEAQAEMHEPRGTFVVRVGRAEVEVRAGLDVQLFATVMKALVSVC
jgi:transposase-like protein